VGTESVPISGQNTAWELAARQHGVIARWQLVELGLTARAIRHRLSVGRLHRIHCRVYAVGRPQLTRRGQWMAAVLACGPGAVLSHGSAAALWGIGRELARTEISVPRARNPRCRHVRTHRRESFDSVEHPRWRIPLTSPAQTLVDLALRLPATRLEAAVNAADKLDLIDPEALRGEIELRRHERGVAALRRLLDRDTFVATDSELERRFLPIARRAGLPKPRTGERIAGHRVDFHWPVLGLVVETDGLRYHRTPAQQARDRRRDQVLTASGLTVLRFTFAQVSSQPEAVEETLRSVSQRLSRRVA